MYCPDLVLLFARQLRASSVWLSYAKPLQAQSFN